MTTKKAKRVPKSYTVRTTVEVQYEIELEVLAHNRNQAQNLAIRKAEGMAFDPALHSGDLLSIAAIPEDAWDTKKGRDVWTV